MLEAPEIKSRNEWIIKTAHRDDSIEVAELTDLFTMRMMNKTCNMFEYKGLPETIPQKDLELILQTGGHVTITEVPDKGLYAFYSGLGGEPNPYYLPTQSIVANPALRFNKSMKIDEECVVILNDNLYQGLMPLNRFYARMLADAFVTLRFALINARIPYIVTAEDDNLKASVEKFFDNLYSGKKMTAIVSSDLTEALQSLKTWEFGRDVHITEIIEGIQYILARWYNSIGLDVAFNMKREAINSAETNLNKDIIFPDIDVYLKCRQIGWDKANKKYGCNVSVDFAGEWKRNRQEQDFELKTLENEAEKVEEEPEEQGGEEDESTGHADGNSET